MNNEDKGKDDLDKKIVFTEKDFSIPEPEKDKSKDKIKIEQDSFQPPKITIKEEDFVRNQEPHPVIRRSRLVPTLIIIFILLIGSGTAYFYRDNIKNIIGSIFNTEKPNEKSTISVLEAFNNIEAILNNSNIESNLNNYNEMLKKLASVNNQLSKISPILHEINKYKSMHLTLFGTDLGNIWDYATLVSPSVEAFDRATDTMTAVVEESNELKDIYNNLNSLLPQFQQKLQELHNSKTKDTIQGFVSVSSDMAQVLGNFSSKVSILEEDSNSLLSEVNTSIGVLRDLPMPITSVCNSLADLASDVISPINTAQSELESFAHILANDTNTLSEIGNILTGKELVD